MTQCASCHSPNPEGAVFCRQCGEGLPHEDPLLGCEILGRYRIRRLIGEGGMGRVYEAEQKVGTTQRRVAVKTLRPELCADPKLARRFFREAETVVRLTHPNLIQFFDFGEVQPGILAMVMEFIEGRSLADVLADGALDAQRATRILAQICGALEEAHGLGIIHRDLKPDNILLTRRGGQDDFVKVLDFGIAKLSAAEDEKSTKLTQQGMMVGTPPYMSPEQFSGESIDARSDTYSLGIIAYEMLTGRLPFDARTPWEWASKHLTAEPAPIANDAMPGILAHHAAAIRRALAKRPEQRQQHISEFFRDFCQILPEDEPLPRVATKASAVSAQPTPQPAASVHIPGVGSARGSVWKGLAALGLLGGLTLAWCARDDAAEDHEGDASHRAPSLVARPPELPATASADLTGADPAQEPAEPSGDIDSAPSSKPKSSEARAHGASRERQRESRAVSPQASSAGSAAALVQPTPSPASARPEAPASSPRAAPLPATNPVINRTYAASTPTGLSDAAEADLRSRVERGLAAAPQRVEVALGLYQAAAARYGTHQPDLVSLRKALTEHGEVRIRELLRARRCAQAQAFFRALSSAGAAGTSRSLFDAGCPAG